MSGANLREDMISSWQPREWNVNFKLWWPKFGLTHNVAQGGRLEMSLWYDSSSFCGINTIKISRQWQSSFSKIMSSCTDSQVVSDLCEVLSSLMVESTFCLYCWRHAVPLPLSFFEEWTKLNSNFLCAMLYQMHRTCVELSHSWMQYQQKAPRMWSSILFVWVYWLSYHEL